jgi:hypothetical protein
VINVLSPGDEQHGDCVVVLLLSHVAVGRHDTGRGEGVAGDGGAGCTDAVGKVGGEEAVVTVHGRAPMRHVQIVAKTGCRPERKGKFGSE